MRLRVRLEQPEAFAVTGDDQRVRLLLPTAAGGLQEVGRAGDWYARWRGLPEARRPASRAYTVRASRPGLGGTIDVDVVLHGLDDGTAGPAARFAAEAGPGDVLAVVGPEAPVPHGVLDSVAGRRAWGVDVPPPSRSAPLLLVADETAVPAVSAVLEGLDADGPPVVALLEVPTGADVLELGPVPPRAQVRWLPRDGAGLGERLAAAVPDAVAPLAADGPLRVWAAGESALVRDVRRAATGAGAARDAVVTVGYWRRGRSGA